jgi:hypothetical protein
MASSSARPGGVVAGRVGPAAVGPARIVLALMVCTDLALVLMHLLHKSPNWKARFPVLEATAFDVSRDLGLAEGFGYVKQLWIVVLLAWLAVLGLRRSYLPWVLLFGYLLVDDLLGIHESVGGRLVLAVGADPEQRIAGGIRAQDAGEVALLAAVTTTVFAMLVVCFVRGTARTRRTYRHLALLTLALAGFGIAVDLVAMSVGPGQTQHWLHLLEDGGELLAISGVLGYVFLLAERARS